MPRGVRNNSTANKPAADKTERKTRVVLTAAQKAQRDVDVAQKKYDAVATKLRSARFEAAKLDSEAKELKVLLDYYKSSPFLPKTVDVGEAVPVLTDGDESKEPESDPLEGGSDDGPDVDEEIAAAENRGDAAPPLTTAPADLPGADQLGDAEEDVASGEVVATDAKPETEEDPFAQYGRS